MRRGSKVERRPGVWDLYVSAGKDPLTGDRRRVTRRVHGTERDAEKALTALQHEVDTGKFGGTLATVATVVERWWDVRGDELSPTTARRYRQIIDQYLLPRWGPERLTDLDPAELAGWFKALQRNGLKRSTVRQIRAILRRALEQAVRWGWLDSNPVSKTDGIKVRRRRQEAADPKVVERLLAEAEKWDEGFGAWVGVAMTTGMRRSEMAGLRWCDLDLLDQVLSVHRAVVQVGRDLHVKGTKTDKPRRMKLDPVTVQVLREHRARALVAACGELPEAAYVWSSDEAGLQPIAPDDMTQAWRRLCKRQDVKGIRLHDLRHFMATQAILAGKDIGRVAQRLGHLQTSTTMNIYADYIEAADEEIADHLGSIVKRRRPDAESDDDGEAA